MGTNEPCDLKGSKIIDHWMDNLINSIRKYFHFFLSIKETFKPESQILVQEKFLHQT